MMKENNIVKADNLVELKNKLNGVFDIIRRTVEVADYHIILYILSLQRYEIFKGKTFEDHFGLFDLIGESDNVLPKDLEKIREDYFLQFDNLSIDTIKSIVELYSSLNQTVLQDYFPEIFDDLLFKLLKFNGRISGELVLSEELNRFVGSLIDFSKSDLETSASEWPFHNVYNPFAGLASFGKHFKQEDDILYYGQELNHTIWLIGTLRLLAYNKPTQFFVEEDSLENWKGAFIEKRDPIWLENTKFQLVISNPPLGLKLPIQIVGRFGPIKTYEHFLIEKGIESLKETGKLIAVITPTFLSRLGSEERLREYLIENDLIEMIISLQSGIIMNTDIPLVIFIINKNKKESEKGVVKFVDAKKLAEKSKNLNESSLLTEVRSEKESDILRIIPNETIVSYRYNLDSGRYFQKIYDGVQLKELGQIIRGRNDGENLFGKFIRIRDLKENALDNQIAINNIEDSAIPRQALKISESCILIAARWKTLKPTYFNYEGTPIYINPDIIAFKLDETKCDIVFLINELHSGYVLEQIDNYRIGSVIPTIRKEDLISIFISIPEIGKKSLEYQKSLVKQRLYSLAEEKKRELNLFNKIHGLEAEIFEQNTFLRHTLAGPASNLRDSVSNIRTILLEKIIPHYPNLFDLKISEKHLKSLGDYISIIERDAEKIVQTVSSQLKVDTGVQSKKLEQIEIYEFLENYSAEYNERRGLNFKTEFQFDKEVFINENGDRIKTYILANKDLLSDLFDNLVNNAVKHAFLPDDKNRIEIYIMKNTEFEDQDEISILFSNTGKPFPENFSFEDFIRKGAGFGLNAGDGVGGWYINEIIKRLNGSLDMIDETGSEGLPGTDLATSFEITFPILEIEEHE
ncbi:MAG: hypothetical protein CFE25_05730 [Chitinophagaceae bacterium BSSC1]|nr:MAG: hypothetical protein CFE25_05730 [Chitinophagaceae bacterium BSSC1]